MFFTLSRVLPLRFPIFFRPVPPVFLNFLLIHLPPLSPSIHARTLNTSYLQHFITPKMPRKTWKKVLLLNEWFIDICENPQKILQKKSRKDLVSVIKHTTFASAIEKQRLQIKKEFFERLYINKQNVVQATVFAKALLKRITNRQ